MAYRSVTAPLSLGDVSVISPRATPAFFDFSIPIARGDSWHTTSQDVLESSVASLTAKERRLNYLLKQTVASREASVVAVPAVLLEAVQTFDTHVSALGALYPSYEFPLARGTDRIRLAIVNACGAVAAKLVAYRPSYPTRLSELYAATSEISISYVAFQATALSLGDRCAAAVAARHLRHVGQLLLSLHDLVPYESVRELQLRGLQATTDNLWEVAGVTGCA